MHQRTIIVTGGSKGIGQAIVKRLCDEKYNVVVFDRMPPLEKLVTAEFMTCDIANEAEVKNAFQKVIEKYTSIYGIVNNAGIISDKVIWKMSLEDFDKVINVNLRGTWLMCREAAIRMKEQAFGKIVNISSRAWLGNPGQTNYSASKAGVVGLSRALALELGKYNVSVNVVAPGLIETELTKTLPPDVLQKLIQAQPQKNIGYPEDVANAVAFLMHEQTRFINGQTLYVDGGKSIGQGI